MCGEEEETNFNHLLQCDGCRSFAHMACYGVPLPPEGRLWLCDLCKLGTLLFLSFLMRKRRTLLCTLLLSTVSLGPSCELCVSCIKPA